MQLAPSRTAAAFGWAAVFFAVVGHAEPRVVRVLKDARVELVDGAHRASVSAGERFGAWTLMAARPQAQTAVLENFSVRDGRIIVVGPRGIVRGFPKSAEPTFATGAPYLGHTLEEVAASPRDLLAEEILHAEGDPDYARIASAFPPLRRVREDVYSFLGCPDIPDKVGVGYGGRTPNFDPAVYQATIRDIRAAGQVWDGLVGGYLPVPRFVYPEANGDWTEMLAFAPLRPFADNDRVQPVWYRVARIERGALAWVRYVDTYLPYPPRVAGDAADFYAALERLEADWNGALAGGLTLDLPDERLSNLARASLLRVMMTRVRGFPKYGAVEKNYGGAEHDGFPDTFTVETAAFLEWGLIDRATAIIDNYFTHFVTDAGAIVYRGPETGQFGRMLTVLAQYVNAGGDPSLLLRHQARIDALTRALLAMRRDQGLIVGWSEADSVLDPDPERYYQPYFSNSTEAARGLRDLGRVWQRLGRVPWGAELEREATDLGRALDAAYARSMLDDDGVPVLPAIADVQQPFHIAVARDRLDPQHRSYRSYMEMLYSGSLPRAQVRGIVDYRARHFDALLGMPNAYGYRSGEVAGFLSYGNGYGLIQHDFIREALLLTYSLAAHQYTRGSWLAPETRQLLNPGVDAAPYCTPAQLSVPMLVKWLLVFEDPQSETLWLAKGAPRAWLAAGQNFAVDNAPTRWGRVSYRISARPGRIDARVELPAGGIGAETRLRLRAPGGSPMKSVSLGGRRWNDFDARAETITIPAGLTGPLEITARY